MKNIIVLTGPESTTKSTLAKELAEYFNAGFFPEYAREYLETRESGYTYNDVVHIAEKQIGQYEEACRMPGELVFLDTWLIITKVWFEWVYKKVPGWLETAIEKYPVSLYLLCRPDIPWVPDLLRENGGEQREALFGIYKNELQIRGFRYAEVGGTGEKRFLNAVHAVKSNICISAHS